MSPRGFVASLEKSSWLLSLQHRVRSVYLKFLAALDELLTVGEFRKNIRAYNQAMAFTSLGTTQVVSDQDRGNGVPYFRIQGEMYHLIGQLLPQKYLK